MRRKERNRQAVLKYRKQRDENNEAYHELLKENEEKAEEKTAKNRKKRDKQKQRLKDKKKNKKEGKATEKIDESESDSVSEEEAAAPVKTVAEPVKPAEEATRKVPVPVDPLLKEPSKKPALVIPF